jgi:hypothetical protein
MIKYDKCQHVTSWTWKHQDFKLIMPNILYGHCNLLSILESKPSIPKKKFPRQKQKRTKGHFTYETEGP